MTKSLILGESKQKQENKDMHSAIFSSRHEMQNTNYDTGMKDGAQQFAEEKIMQSFVLGERLLKFGNVVLLAVMPAGKGRFM